LTARRDGPIVRSMLRLPDPPPAGNTDPRCLARASGSLTVLTLGELARRLPQLQPPAAYRLSLDSGIEYKNVRRAFEQPLAVRLDTWQKLLRSLRIRLVAAASAEDVIWPGASTRMISFWADAGALAAAENASSLRSYRLTAGWSRRELARRAGVGLDAVASLEGGHGMAGTLAKVCHAFGLQLLLALPPVHATLEELWEDRAGRCLAEPAQFPPGRPRGQGPHRATPRNRAAHSAAGPDAP
jgi:transcriptional regulator with XRE-family HTH domain